MGELLVQKMINFGFLFSTTNYALEVPVNIAAFLEAVYSNFAVFQTYSSSSCMPYNSMKGISLNVF